LAAVLVFLICTVIQLVYLWFVFGRLAFYTAIQKPQGSLPVSVVLCGREVTPGMEESLKSILNQDYPDFEIVVVNESPEEDIRLYLESLSRNYSRIKVVNIGENLNFFKGRKFPLSIGIKSAKNDIILVTDIDCMPCSDKWINGILSNFDGQTEVVLGYSNLKPKLGLINQWLRFNNLQSAVKYLSFAICGVPYMGVGRNLAYRKELFYKSHGFISHYTLITGEDDLFVNAVSNAKNTRIEISHDSQTQYEGKISFLGWLLLKKKQLETQRFYKSRHKLLLAINSFSLFFFYAAFIFLLVYTPGLWIPILSVFGVRFLSYIFILKKCMLKLKEKDLLLISPVYEVLLLLIMLFLRLSIIFVKSNKWK
jgi:glycosyltransferase involved in cell wall biosynthesis